VKCDDYNNESRYRPPIRSKRIFKPEFEIIRDKSDWIVQELADASSEKGSLDTTSDETKQEINGENADKTDNTDNTANERLPIPSEQCVVDHVVVNGGSSIEKATLILPDWL